MQPLPLNYYTSPFDPGLNALFLYGLMIVVLIGLLLFLASRLGEKKGGPEKDRPYECGIIPSGESRLYQPLPFYSVAVFFLIFDVEAVFIFAWAIASLELGWAGWLQISFFIVLLLAGLFYIWRKKGLDWVQGFEKIRPAQD
jgi:NADH-quinone oxidoreductase subunit A